ncbi:hypothetical protein LPTSP4_08460 [Leptospira ryugenii]|uniref:Uncharacterized protein n=1 Tax=Leptospira ryugenii TaxID=1917863 RepID=A0A2P2DXH3_9LEPT|nr:hypothetical protein LPTSP4_08460 [Leptospira ryugenii]
MKTEMKVLGTFAAIYIYSLIILPSHPHLYRWFDTILVVMFDWTELKRRLPDIYISLPSIVFWLYIFYLFARTIVRDNYL